MSPRRTEAFHQIGDGEHLGAVFVVGLQYGDLDGKHLFATESRRGLD